MGIDWFTFIAQIVNFLILVVLLKRFLYGPILRAMDERESGIAARIADAKRSREQAEEEAESFRRKNAVFEREYQQRLSDAQQQVQTEQHKWMSEARSQVDRTREAWNDALEREQAASENELRRAAAEQAVTIARRVLTTFADQELNRRIVRHFVERIRELPAAEAKLLRTAMASDGNPTIVSSAFPLEDDEKALIDRILSDEFGASRPPQYARSDEMLCGIELRSAGHKVGWSFDDYLDSLQLAYETELAGTQPVAKNAAPAPESESDDGSTAPS